MFDSQCDLAALVYERDQDPDRVLHDFASDLNIRGYRAVGLVQTGHHCVGEERQLFQNLGAGATGCRLDVGKLLDAGAQIANAIDEGADLVIVNRFGRQECEGKGLSYLVERAERGYSGRDRGAEASLRGLDQICRRHERQAALRPHGAGGLVECGVSTQRRHDRARSPDRLRSPEVAAGGRLHTVGITVSLSHGRHHSVAGHSVSCWCPHCLQANFTRVAPFSAEIRLGAPHLPQSVSMRVLPCFTTMVLRSMVSRIRRSASSRIDCFDILFSPPWKITAAL